MSKTRREKVNCPECGQEQEVIIWDSVETALNPEAREEILHNDLFMFQCEACGHRVQMVHTCLYHDIENKMLVYMVPDYDTDEKEKFRKMIQEMGDILPEDKRQGYISRIAPNANALKEKIMIRQEGLDDRIIELMKLFYIAQVQDSLDGGEIMEVLFDSSNKKNGFVFLMKNKNPMFGEINDAAYSTLEKDFAQKIEDNTPNGFAEIDLKWAQKVASEE